MHTDVTTPESESGLLQVRGGSEVLFALFVSPHRSPGASHSVISRCPYGGVAHLCDSATSAGIHFFGTLLFEWRRGATAGC